MKRKIICHVGPTNSGKTHAALQALVKAKSGVYCGPLRLLAWEVCEKMRQHEVTCGLLTGQEKDLPTGYSHIACTVEMADLQSVYDVAVVDEVQLVGDEHRGWAWTNAILGLRASEIHVCGNPALLPVIQKICAKTKDELIIRQYNRLSSLEVAEDALGSYRYVKPGDCIVGFSRRRLYQLKYEIERQCKGLRCCVIYGNLPPSARQQQAALFNDVNSEYDVLVASDAIGMGLNLSIRRIIFSSIEKFDGRERRLLNSSEVKQIGGRAGRFGTIFERGEVTCLRDDDLPYLSSMIQEADSQVLRAGLFPSSDQLELLSVLVDYRIGSNILSLFILNADSAEWDLANETYVHLSSSNGVESSHQFDIELIKSKFGTLSSFIAKFERFLIASSFIDQRYRSAARRVRRKRKARHKRIFGVTISNDNSDDTSSFNTEPKDCNSFFDPLTPLAALFDRFRRVSNLGAFASPQKEHENSSDYFLCDLDERVLLAESIDDLPLTFREKYLFCMAPVEPDDTGIMNEYIRFATSYAQSRKVRLDSKLVKHILNETSNSIKTPEQLERLEQHHKVFDVYLWLGQRFQDNFLDMKLAVSCSTTCARLIGEALQRLGPNVFRASSKGKVAKKLQNRQTQSRVVVDDDIEDENDDYDDKDDEYATIDTIVATDNSTTVMRVRSTTDYDEYDICKNMDDSDRTSAKIVRLLLNDKAK